MALGINKGNANRQYQQSVRLHITVPRDSAGSDQHWPGNRRSSKDQECESEVSIRQSSSSANDFSASDQDQSRSATSAQPGLHLNTQSRRRLDCAIQVSSLDGGVG